MNVSYRWLRELAPTLETDPNLTADRLASLGFPVEGTERLAEGMDGLVVGRVTQVRAHPNADRLRLCDVDPGDGETVQVVCGAPVIQEGGLYPFAPVGSTLPGGMEIRKARLRGESSSGMLCSEKELGLGSDAGGIMQLPASLTPGQPLVDALGLEDVRMDVEVTSNRPDLLSHRGIAREVAPGGSHDLVLPPIPGASEELERMLDGVKVVTGAGEATAETLTVRIEDAERCPAYLGLVLRGVTVEPSPPWLAQRLRAAGARPINNVVDATNYVLLELGHPLHAFDLDQVAERTVIVRRAGEGEILRTLDGADRTLVSDDLVIADPRGAMAVAGVMGGLDSEVGPETRDVLLECALFTPGPIRTTRKRLGLSTDASYRFERGVDPEGLREAILRAARIILATAGGRVDGPVVEARPEPFRRRKVELRVARVETVLGIDFSPERIRELLSPLGLGVEGSVDGVMEVEVPGFRSWDLTREVDLIEEVARTHGYDAFPETLAPFRPGTVPDDPLFVLEDRLRDDLVAQGFFEAHTLAFSPPEEGEVELLNPVSVVEGTLRRSILPGLLRRVAYNLARGNRDLRLFEIGTTFRHGDAGALPREDTTLAVVLHGRRNPPHWSTSDEPLDPWDLKGVVESLAARIPGAEVLVPETCEEDPVAGAIFEGDPLLQVRDSKDGTRGWAGILDLSSVDLPPWSGVVWGAEIRLPRNPDLPEAAPYRALPTRPGVERDLALLVPDDRPVGPLLALIREGGGPDFRGLDVFDVYEGGEVPEGHRSVAVRLRFRADDRTLTDREVDDQVHALTIRLKEEFGVEIRDGRS